MSASTKCRAKDPTACTDPKCPARRFGPGLSMHEAEHLAATNEARAELDMWEHYNDHAGFIAEVGGQAAYDKEYDKRAKNFFDLDMKSRW